MTTNLNKLALTLDESAPDRRIAALMERERDKIDEALRTVGEYVLSDDDGRIYVITASAAPAQDSAEPPLAGAVG